MASKSFSFFKAAKGQGTVRFSVYGDEGTTKCKVDGLPKDHTLGALRTMVKTTVVTTTLVVDKGTVAARTFRADIDGGEIAPFVGAAPSSASDSGSAAENRAAGSVPAPSGNGK